MDVFDYLEQELATFDTKPLNCVDSAVLSQFCMVDGTGVIPGVHMRQDDSLSERLADWWRSFTTPGTKFADLFRAELFEGMFRGLTPGLVKQELAGLVASPRFRDLTLSDYAQVDDDKDQVQFSAMTFTWHARSGSAPEHDFAYVGFRGTDDGFTGWRENFNMFVDPPVPAQRLAVEYLESVARHIPGRIYVGGHSKGANLATYASIRCSDATRARIVRVFEHDGPGFRPGFMTQADYDLLAGRIDRTVPNESVVGMLMESFAPYRVVQSTATGIQAHSIYTWQIDVPNDDFVYAPGLSDAAIFTRDVMSEWIAGLTDEESPRIVDALFRAIDASGASGASQIFAGGPEFVGLLMEAARNMDKETRDILVPELTKLAGIAARRGVAGVFAGRRATGGARAAGDSGSEAATAAGAARGSGAAGSVSVSAPGDAADGSSAEAGA